MGVAMLALTQNQLDHIALVCRPLQPADKQAFLGQLFDSLIHRRDDVGEGELHRMLRDLQRRHFRPPTETEDTRQGARPLPVVRR
jgi:hypothetical protein